MTVFVLTGCTGLLGRNLLFEIFKQNLHRLSSLHIVALGRSTASMSLSERLADILRTDGCSYLNLSVERYAKLEPLLLSRLECIELHCGQKQADVAAPDLQRLRSVHIDYFIHSAALVDFRNTPAVEKELWQVNVEGTRELLQLIEQLHIGELVNIGTAYACGKTGGHIQPDYSNLAEEFRNPYERSKLTAELLVRDYQARTGQQCRYFRPSTICGRLIEPVWGTTHKFDVFYAWAGFFNHLKQNKMRLEADENWHLDFRVCYHPHIGLNIVPADYCAKIIYKACTENYLHANLHLANPTDTPNELFIPAMLRFLNIHGMTRTDAVPDDPTHLESLYYKTVGKIYTPYVTGNAMQFDVSNLTSLGIACPPVDEHRFRILLDYAQAMNFGHTHTVPTSVPHTNG